MVAFVLVTICSIFGCFLLGMAIGIISGVLGAFIGPTKFDAWRTLIRQVSMMRDTELMYDDVQRLILHNLGK